MAEQAPAITLERVCKSFGPNRVLHEVSLVLPAGKILVMLGPSGTGKSVLLRCLVGLMKPDSGRIFIEGEDITALDERRSADRDKLFALRRKFGMLFQDGALFDDMCVGDNVAFPLRQHTKLSEKDIARQVAANLKSVGLEKTQDKMPAELSGGMRKRVAFARAIALQPKIVLCDEPSSGLDPVMSATLDDVILDLHRSRPMTFVVISHDTAEARKIADYIGLLYKGELLAFGPKDEVLRSNGRAVNQFFDRSTEGPIKVV
jgi:phospholipid/cholesterol/gamma-HCH transport system ATP-binding protein